MSQLRDLPAVDTLLSEPALSVLCAEQGAKTVRNEIRTLQTQIRKSGLVPEWGLLPEAYAQRISSRLRHLTYTPVFNLTGTVIHTNLGRALLSQDMWETLTPLVTRPNNLEYDLDAGKRGNRDLIVERRLQTLTGCEAATIVNNNAAALLLVLNTFALGKSVPVSRGELIEIGGSFRLPELMTRSGCQLLEVGTTNRTHPHDFENVLDQAAMLLKVHPSNYHIDGFTEEVTAGQLAQLAQGAGIPSCVDLGSGTLVDLTRWGLPPEPTPQSVLADGIDLVTFSGDKLLGGVQAGIICGPKALVDQIKRNPLKRALRADKVTLAILEATLRLYEDPDTLSDQLPLLRTLTLDASTLAARGDRLLKALPDQWQAEICPSQAQIGSGALPDRELSSSALVLTHPSHKPTHILKTLRGLSTPVIGRIHEDRVWLDLRGAEPLEELAQLLASLP